MSIENADVAASGDAAAVELLGLLAYAELTASFRLAEDAALAPTLTDKAALGEMAAAEFEHFQRLRAHLAEIGADAESAMGPFAEALDAFHVQTRPRDWLESLIKAYVGDGIATDFYREIAGALDPRTREFVLEVLQDTGHSAFAIEHVQAAIADDPKIAGKLALWARRLVGEALAQAQRVALEHPGLAQLVVGRLAEGQESGDDLAAVTELFARLTSAHAERMNSLGLNT